MTTVVCCPGENRARDVIELRSLVELSALRRLAERGLRDEDMEAMRRLAAATMRSALSSDGRGYRRADVAFHRQLLALTGDRALLQAGRSLVAASVEPRPCADQGPCAHPGQSAGLAANGAREHAQLLTMLADDDWSAADDLLRRHIAGSPPGRDGGPWPIG